MLGCIISDATWQPGVIKCFQVFQRQTLLLRRPSWGDQSLACTPATLNQGATWHLSQRHLRSTWWPSYLSVPLVNVGSWLCRVAGLQSPDTVMRLCLCALSMHSAEGPVSSNMITCLVALERMIVSGQSVVWVMSSGNLSCWPRLQVRINSVLEQSKQPIFLTS